MSYHGSNLNLLKTLFFILFFIVCRFRSKLGPGTSVKRFVPDGNILVVLYMEHQGLQNWTAID